MTDNKGLISIHPEGEWRKAGFDAWGMVGSLDTFAGKVHVRWAPEAAVSSHGLLPYFIEFLKVSGRFDAWVADCPLDYTSGNAPQKRDVLGTILLSVLAGHWRYAHISAIRGDGVNPGLLGMTKIASEDSVRRAMKDADDILIRITAANRGPDAATLHLLPTLWFRNTWSWGRSLNVGIIWCNLVCGTNLFFRF